MSVWQHSYNRLNNKNSSVYQEVSSLWTTIRHVESCLYCGVALDTLSEVLPDGANSRVFNDILLGQRSSRRGKEKFSRLHRFVHGRTFEEYQKMCPCCG